MNTKLPDALTLKAFEEDLDALKASTLQKVGARMPAISKGLLPFSERWRLRGGSAYSSASFFHFGS
jgi:hypothetical protein